MNAVVRVKSGSKFEDIYKFSRLVKAGNWIYSSNTAGRNYQTREMSSDVSVQAHQSLSNLENALAALEAKLSDVVRIHISVSTPDDLDPVLTAIAERVGGNDPAHTIAIGPLPNEEMRVELAIIAYVRNPETPDIVQQVTV
jgi:2-iminobutanoate/2-iminopropanoate deaminase